MEHRLISKAFWFRRHHLILGRYVSVFDLCVVAGVVAAVFWVRWTQLLMMTILAISVILHEVAHGKMAEYLGDPTAKNLGRLSVNPLVHIDPVGTIFLPMILVFSGASFLFGWAKPVPIDTRYFKDPIGGMMWVALAGPVTNLLIAFGCVIGLKGLIQSPVFGAYSQDVAGLLVYSVIINCVLAVFNMIPIPPLDGSRVIMNFLPYSAQSALMRIEPYGLFIVMALVYFGAFDGILRWTIQGVFKMLGI